MFRVIYKTLPILVFILSSVHFQISTNVSRHLEYVKMANARIQEEALSVNVTLVLCQLVPNKNAGVSAIFIIPCSTCRGLKCHSTKHIPKQLFGRGIPAF